MKTTEKIYDVSSGKTSIVERDMTNEELQAWEEEQQRIENALVVAQEQSEKRKAILEKLGITDEEAKLLLG